MTAGRESSQAARPASHRIRIRASRVAGLLAGIAGLAAALGGQWPASSPSTPEATVDAPRGEHRGAPGRTTVPDDELPGVTNLDPALRDALRDAAAHAARERVEFRVDSGWRSPEYQEHLLREAIRKHGSEERARRWVATPETSAHVSGDAVDIGPPRAAAWLSEHGAEHGLCQIYRNEPWHYELRREARDHGCPAMYADPSHDPRMQP